MVQIDNPSKVQSGSGCGSAALSAKTVAAATERGRTRGRFGPRVFRASGVDPYAFDKLLIHSGAFPYSTLQLGERSEQS